MEMTFVFFAESVVAHKVVFKNLPGCKHRIATGLCKHLPGCLGQDKVDPMG